MHEFMMTCASCSYQYSTIHCHQIDQYVIENGFLFCHVAHCVSNSDVRSGDDLKAQPHLLSWTKIKYVINTYIKWLYLSNALDSKVIFHLTSTMWTVFIYFFFKNNNNIAECFHLYFSSNTGKRLQVNEVHL